MNEACCTRAPPLTTDAKPSGEYITLDNGMRCYQVGPPNATRAVIFGYDALGYTQPQLLGADLLASKLPNTQVYVPDFFEGNPVDPSAFSLPKEQLPALFEKFLSGPGNFEKGVENAKIVVGDVKKVNPKLEKVGWQGFCWGGKIAILLSGSDSPFAVTAACHPGRLDVNDVKGRLSVPHVCLLSGEDGSDEQAEEYRGVLEGSGKDVVYERFQDSVHGWMSARADLKDEKVRGEYERGYTIVAEFFEKYL